MKRERNLLFVIVLALSMASLALAACGGSDNANTAKVAFIYPEKAENYNWSHLHELGRQYLMEKLPDLETKTVEEVSADQAEQVLRDLVADDYSLIFATAAQYNDAVLKVAAEFPETRFEVCQGEQTAANVATYDGRMYQAFYLAGGYAGDLTVTGIIGFVAPEPTVEVIRHINAFTLATWLVRASGDLAIHVKWTGAWDDPEASRAAALELIDEGADVLIQHTYDPEVQKVAEEKGVRSIGYGFDMREFASKMNTTSVVYNWGWYYVQRVNAAAADAWTGEAYLGGVSNKSFGAGIVDIAPYTYDQIPQIMESIPMKWRTKFTETNRDVFEGPIEAQNGEEILARGEKFDEDFIYNKMDWFVFGVVGDAPGTPPAPASD